jgi:hypothetical protein
VNHESNETEEEKKRIADGCFNIMIAILGAFAIAGMAGWPAGVCALIVALCALRIFGQEF